MRKKWLVFALGLMLAIAIPGATMPGASAAVDYDSVDADVPGNATGFSYQNNLVELENGTFVTVYTDQSGSTTNITARYSLDGGDTWSDGIWIDKNTTWNESEPCITINYTSGTVHIVYTAYNDTNYSKVYYNRLWDSNWTAGTPCELNSLDSTNKSQPYVAMSDHNADERVWIVYRQQVTGDWRIFIVGSTDDGETIGEASNLFSDADINQSWPCLATDMNGTVHLTYSEENGTDGRWDLYYCRLVHSYGSASTPLQVDWETTYNQVEGKIVVGGPVTIGGTSIEGKFFFWTEQTNDTATQEIHWVYGDTGRDGTPNQSMVMSDDGYRVTASANLTGIRAVWTDGDEHLHYSYLNVDWESIFALNPADYDTWEEVLEALTSLINYAIDEEINISLNYSTYFDTWASLMWYYDGGNNTVDKMVFTHGASTYVVFYDFDDDWSVSEYQWITNLINMIISITGMFLVIIVIFGMVKGINKSIK